MNKLLIIDGNAIVHRAYHAIPPMHTKDGVVVNAVYGFTSMLIKVWKDLAPTHIAVTFDIAGGSASRLEKFKEYKGTRVKADQELYDQMPLVHELVESFNIPIYEKKGYEADDVIGSIVHQVHKVESPVETFIVTGDMDTLQLIQPGVKIYTLRKGMSDVVIYDAMGVKERFGFGPEMMVDYKALRGDVSDNIPGVPGIGEKTATELITNIGSIENIYKYLKNNKKILTDKFKPGVIKKLEAGEEKAKMSFELATIDCHVPDLDFKLADCSLKSFDKEKIVKLFQKFEFVSLLKRIPGLHDAVPEEVREKKTVVKKAPAVKFALSEIENSDEAKELVKNIIKQKQFACRAVLNGKDVFTGKLDALIFVVEQKAYLVKPKFFAEAMGVFAHKDIELVGHDLKQLIKALANTCHPEQGEGSLSRSAVRDSSATPQNDNVVWVKNKLFDVMIASYLLNPGSRAHDIPSVVLKVLGENLVEGSGQESLFGADYKVLAHELFLISKSAEKLRVELEKIDDKGLLEKVEMPLVPVLAEMELNGVALDTKLLKKLSGEGAEKIKEVSEKIYKLAGQEFNISSPLQLREILFDKLDIPVEGIKKGKTGLSTGAEQLEKMRGLHPIIDEITEYRELAKLQNTYLDVLPTLINPKTGRIHTTFNQAVTATGRLSCSDPNLQNIPIRTELGRKIRHAFIADEGYEIMSADYSQIELRIVASLAEDKKMIEIFEKGLDIHAATAAAINNVPLEKVTKDMRRAAKEVNFGVLYGMGTHGLSWRAEISYAEAKAFIEKYFHEFSGVKKYLDRTLEFTRKEGYCETLFGRRRYIPELNSQNHQLRAAAERMAVNHPVQGTAADLMKMAMIQVSEKLKEKNSDVRMLLQVHDELVFEVKESEVENIGKLVKETMEGVVKLRVPIEVHVSTGKNWGETK